MYRGIGGLPNKRFVQVQIIACAFRKPYFLPLFQAIFQTEVNQTNLFQTVRFHITARDAAVRYGLNPNHHNMCVCPFHADHTPSMKVDERFFCFGCGAKGDVIDLTAHLFQLPLKLAAEKLLDDFGIFAGNEPEEPSVMKQIQKNPEQEKREWLLHTADILIEYEKLLKQWRTEYAPKNGNEPQHPLFLESLRQLDRITYLTDMALCSDKREQEALYRNFSFEIDKIQRRITEYKNNEHNREEQHE